jgi:hypothetical protein
MSQYSFFLSDGYVPLTKSAFSRTVIYSPNGLYITVLETRWGHPKPQKTTLKLGSRYGDIHGKY